MYSINTGSILQWMGYKWPDDFEFYADGRLEWFHSDPKPSVSEIEAQVKPWAASVRREEILRQIPVFSATNLTIDPLAENDVIRYSAAAADRLRELEESDDPENFDPTIQVADPQADVAYSRLSVTIQYLEPWVGAPADDIGFRAYLQTADDRADEGDEARLLVVSGADQGAVLPFTQDPTDTSVWVVDSRDGNKWADPEQPITVQLLWGAGSLIVSPTITCKRLYDRKAVAVRYGVPAGQGRSGGRFPSNRFPR